jgi:hypothetical protein
MRTETSRKYAHKIPSAHFMFEGAESGVRKFIPNGVVPDRQSKLAPSRPGEAAGSVQRADLERFPFRHFTHGTSQTARKLLSNSIYVLGSPLDLPRAIQK